MPRELRYRVPAQRLRKLGRSADWKVNRTERLLALLLLAAFGAAFGTLWSDGAAINRWTERAGVPFASDLGNVFANIILVALGFLSISLLLKRRTRKLERHVDFDQDIHLTEDKGGLRFASTEIEYYVKWRGIGLLLPESDGIALSCGNLFFFIPNVAFPSADERLAFVRDVYGRLSENARSFSEKYVRMQENGRERP